METRDKTDEVMDIVFMAALIFFIFAVLAYACGRAIDADQTPDHIRAERAAILEGRQ